MDGNVLPFVALLGIVLIVPLAGMRVCARRGRSLSGRIARDGVREVEILVRGGFHPASIRVCQGERVRLLFRRAEDVPCTGRVYLMEPRTSRVLPAFATTALTFVADTAGRHLFTCEEGRHRGHLLVEPVHHAAAD
ncbi:MAG: cupredoxin domain-containing protein [Thermomicrobiales bacterium]|nr:cupredoxin domain-containing protein [Thermomicrobiales bacterium]